LVMVLLTAPVDLDPDALRVLSVGEGTLCALRFVAGRWLALQSDPPLIGQLGCSTGRPAHQHGPHSPVRRKHRWSGGSGSGTTMAGAAGRIAA
jgi:hypothetical protein